MWIFSKYGFYSIAEINDKEVVVRARCKLDLQRLRKPLFDRGVAMPRIIEMPMRDYRYRVVLGKGELEDLMKLLADSVDYSNFKDEISSQTDKMEGPDKLWNKIRVLYYSTVWSTMLDFQEKLVRSCDRVNKRIRKAGEDDYRVSYP